MKDKQALERYQGGRITVAVTDQDVWQQYCEGDRGGGVKLHRAFSGENQYQDERKECQWEHGSLEVNGPDLLPSWFRKWIIPDQRGQRPMT